MEITWNRKKWESHLTSECGRYSIRKHNNRFHLYCDGDYVTSDRSRINCQNHAQNLESERLRKIRKCWVQGFWSELGNWRYRLIGVTYGGDISYCTFMVASWIKENESHYWSSEGIVCGSAKVNDLVTRALDGTDVEFSAESIKGW